MIYTATLASPCGLVLFTSSAQHRAENAGSAAAVVLSKPQYCADVAMLLLLLQSLLCSASPSPLPGVDTHCGEVTNIWHVMIKSFQSITIHLSLYC